MVWLIVCWLLLAARTVGAVPDLANDGELDALLGSIARDKEVIMFVFQTKMQTDLGRMWHFMQLNLVTSLHAMGYEHFIALTDSPDNCGFAIDHCAYSSEPFNHVHRHDIFTLWSERYYVLARIAERGFNVLLIDVDFVFHKDIYPILNQPPLNEAAAVVMLESPLNGGVTYVRGSVIHKHGGVLWMYREVERRSTLIVEHALHSESQEDAGTAMDQSILADAIRVASQNLSEWNWRQQYDGSPHKSNSFWLLHPQDAPATSFAWRTSTELHSIPNSTCPVSNDPKACARWDKYLQTRKFLDTPLLFTDVTTPMDSAYYNSSVGPERIIAGPAWLWGHGELLTHGWPEASGGTHLLGAEQNWANRDAGTHIGRMAVLLSNYMFDVMLLPSPHSFELMKPFSPGPDSSNSSVYIKRHIRSFYSYAVQRGLVPIFTNFSCSLEWIAKSDCTRSGLLDHRVLQTNDGRCYPAPGGWESCFPFKHYMYDFMLNKTNRGIIMPKPTSAYTEACREYEQILL